jgi:hypothetical protein
LNPTSIVLNDDVPHLRLRKGISARYVGATVNAAGPWQFGAVEPAH